MYFLSVVFSTVNTEENPKEIMLFFVFWNRVGEITVFSNMLTLPELEK